jgi:hypothetical protein
MPAIGTRTKRNFSHERPTQGHETRFHTADPGMAKRVVASLTFTASDGRITGANGTFTGTFAADDPLLVEGVALNNGMFNITALDGVNAAYLVVDPPPKDEGPISATLRTE